MALEIDRDCHEMHNDAIDIKVGRDGEHSDQHSIKGETVRYSPSDTIGQDSTKSVYRMIVNVT